MRHHSKTKKFDRSQHARKGLMKSLAIALFSKERITTTEAKAKALRPYSERLITAGKKGTVAGLKQIIAVIGDNAEARKVQNEFAKRYADRKGGYTRVIKMPRRAKDASPMAVIELVK